MSANEFEAGYFEQSEKREPMNVLFMLRAHPNTSRPSNLRSMLLFIVTVCLFAFSVGCTVTRSLTTPNSHTDYVIGNTYSLLQPAYLRDGNLFPLGNDGTPTTISNFKLARPAVEIAESGTKLEVTRVQIVRAPGIGSLAEVYATIRSGSLNGTAVGITWISRQMGKLVFTGVDTNFVQTTN